MNASEKGTFLQLIKRNILGVFLALIVTILGIYGAQLIGVGLEKINLLPEGGASPISGIFVAILIGIIVRNFIGLHESFYSGIAFTLKYALRTGIILLGLRLSLAEAFKLGAWGLPLIVITISSGLIITLYFTKRMNESIRLGTLIAAGTGICGVTAIMAISPVIKAKDDEISYAVANITIFGLIGMLFYPYLANILFLGDPVKAGLFLGTAIHDTAQVTGAALIYNEVFNVEQVVNVATVTKLTRNLFIIAVIPIISYMYYKNSNMKESNTIPKWYKFVPLFVLGFVLLSFIRTLGDFTLESRGLAFGLLDASTWTSFHETLSSFGSTYMLGMAMASVGLSTNFKMFKSLGLKPFYIGLFAALSVGVISLLLVTFLGSFINV